MEERLQNILAHAGVASRRAAATMIESGVVTVDGIVVREPGARFEPEKVAVRVNGRPLVSASAKRTIVLYKPVGVLSTMSDPFGGRTVADIVYGGKGNSQSKGDATFKGYATLKGDATFLSREKKAEITSFNTRQECRVPSERLVPVGRLDKDSEGLLLMSNDGDLVNRLTHPRFEHQKTYLVRVAGRWTEEKLATLRSPLTLDDGYTIRPVPVEVVRENFDHTRLLKFVLKEGRKRQIRKMCSAAHLVVLSLKRVKVGAFALPSELKPGEWRDLTPDEIKALFA